MCRFGLSCLRTDGRLVIRGIQEQLESLVKWFEAKRKQSPETQARLNAVVASVKRIEIPARYERLEELSWPTLGAAANVAQPGALGKE